MQAALRKVRFTYDDYLLLPWEKRYELIDGDLHMVPAPLTTHQRALSNLHFLLKKFIDGKKLGELLFAPADVVLSEEDVVQPDILFISENRLGILTEKNIQGAPDLVIEVLSPSSVEWDRKIKKKLYEKYGVREYWIVDPSGRSVEILTMGPEGLKVWQVFSGDNPLHSPLLEGLSFPISEIFR